MSDDGFFLRVSESKNTILKGLHSHVVFLPLCLTVC